MLTDRQRVELALPARFMYSAAMSATENPSDPTMKAINDDLAIACREPIEGLAEKDKRKVARRIERMIAEIGRPYVEKCTAGKMAMVCFYFIEELIGSGSLELYEGSAMARATNRFLQIIGPKFEIADMDRSAKRQGRKVLEHCRSMGLYGASA